MLCRGNGGRQIFITCTCPNTLSDHDRSSKTLLSRLYHDLQSRMSSRPPTGAGAVRELEEEIASGGGEGDEIMEEPEEQEDGYSACQCFFPTPRTRRSPFGRFPGQ